MDLGLFMGLVVVDLKFGCNAGLWSMVVLNYCAGGTLGTVVVNQIASMLFGYQVIAKKVKKEIEKIKMKICLVTNGKKIK